MQRAPRESRLSRVPERGSLTIYSIGHSTRVWEEFVSLLRRHAIARLVDIRAFPGSRRYPQFNQDRMISALRATGIEYAHLSALGGRRRPRPGAAPTGWRNSGFQGYADYMTTDEFAAGVEELLRLAEEKPTAVMCSEAVPWRCHRTLLSDALLARDARVLHILDEQTRPHTLTAFAVLEGGAVRYEPAGGEQLEANL